MKTEQQKMTFKDYLDKKKVEYPEFIEKACKLLDISRESFYRKLRDNAFTIPEKFVLANFMHRDVEELFPEPEKKTA